MTWIAKLHHYANSDDPQVLEYDTYADAEHYVRFYAQQNNLKLVRVELLPFRWAFYTQADNRHVGWVELSKKENYVINRIREWVEEKAYHCPHDDIVINYDLFMELLDNLESEQK